MIIGEGTAKVTGLGHRLLQLPEGTVHFTLQVSDEILEGGYLYANLFKMEDGELVLLDYDDFDGWDSFNDPVLKAAKKLLGYKGGRISRGEGGEQGDHHIGYEFGTPFAYFLVHDCDLGVTFDKEYCDLEAFKKKHTILGMRERLYQEMHRDYKKADSTLIKEIAAMSKLQLLKAFKKYFYFTPEIVEKGEGFVVLTRDEALGVIRENYHRDIYEKDEDGRRSNHDKIIGQELDTDEGERFANMCQTCEGAETSYPNMCQPFNVVKKMCPGIECDEIVGGIFFDKERDRTKRANVIQYLAERDADDLAMQYAQGEEGLIDILKEGCRGYNDMSNGELRLHYKQASGTDVEITDKKKDP